jgi:vitamin B12 transporter
MSYGIFRRNGPIMRTSLLLGSVVSFICVDAALAAESDSELDSVVVTATRSEQRLDRVGDSITVLDAATVREHQKTSIAELLASTPGVAVSRNGGFGGTTSLRIRGAEDTHTVVLIDGVKLNDPSSASGGYNFAELLGDDVSRIEVLRGPQSTLWGSQAIGGVVNIVTPLPEGPVTSTVAVEGGSRETAHVRAKVEAGNERVAWRMNGGYFRTDGISAFDENLGGAEHDSYKNTSFAGRVRVRLNDAISVDTRASYWRGRNEFDGFPRPAFVFTDTAEYGTTEEIVAYTGLDASSFAGRWTHRLGYAFTDTDRENFDPALSVRTTFDATGRNGRWEYQGTVKLAEGYETVFGLESERSELNTASPTEEIPNPIPLARDVRMNSAYAQIQGTPVSSLTLTAGLRRDDHDTFGEHTTARAALAWAVAPQTLVRASYGEGLKAPTLFQLFSEFGTTGLRPEEAEGWDAGVEQRLLGERLVLSATYFDRDTTNQIDFVSCTSSPDPRCAAQPFGGFYQNVAQTQATGMELAAVAKWSEALKLSANYTRTEAENTDRGDANFGRDLQRRPRDTANADVSYRWAFGLLTSVSVQYVGKSFDDEANLFPLDAYTLVDLRASQQVTDRIEVFGRVENAFDEDYETVLRYGSIGRGFFVGARTSF